MSIVIFYNKDYILVKKCVYYTLVESKHILLPVGTAQTLRRKGQNVNIFNSAFF